MLLAGDKFLVSQPSNNNPRRQANEITWVNWEPAQTNAAFMRFVRAIVIVRESHPSLIRRTFFHGLVRTNSVMRTEYISHGVEPFTPDFSHDSRTVAYALDGTQTGREPDCDFYVALNAWRERLPFRVPPSPTGRPWHRVADTAQPSPLDIMAEDAAPRVA